MVTSDTSSASLAVADRSSTASSIGQAWWSTHRARRSRAGTLSLKAPFASKPGAPARWDQDVNWSRRLIDQVVQEA